MRKGVFIMVNFSEVIKGFTDENGNISQDNITALTEAIKKSVGTNFVDKERYKTKILEIEKLREKQQEIEDMTVAVGKWEAKYNELKGEFDTYRAEVTENQTLTTKSQGFKDILRGLGIADNRINAITKISDIRTLVELDEQNNIKNTDKITEYIKAEFDEFIPTTETVGADVARPPINNENIKDPFELGFDLG